MANRMSRPLTRKGTIRHKIPRELAGFRLLRYRLIKRGVPSAEADRIARETVTAYRFSVRRWPDKAEDLFSCDHADNLAQMFEASSLST